MRHRPEDHKRTCYCGAPATKHVMYGSGCGNVCDKHAASIKAMKKVVQIEAPILVGAP